MADEADIAAQLEAEHISRSLQSLPVPISGTDGGICEDCELPSPRLFGGQCTWCHDGRDRPDQHQPEPAPRIAPVTFERGRKPFIPAHIIRAANDAGQSLDVFVTALILRGFAAFEAANSKGA
ncbi:hypothetical protein SPKIRA_08200 [Sphingomonas paucimobilis]|uniref:hypothetical protein n=1 Tax=Sphingomonas paucimobilis TaxID=13689 RepID=UPI0015DD25C5|nr:hypothetical protein [Sphingomonas paucimobilis]BCI69990.1 hypothetical protein SPKIRA_08200 [Sphingomonas paucimobilis]